MRHFWFTNLLLRFLMLSPLMIAGKPVLAADCGFYQYKAVIVGVYDGDTVTADIDLGFNTWRKAEKLRLWGIDSPEVRGKERETGLLARDVLRERILHKSVTICTIQDKTGKYGRYLVKIYDDAGYVNSWMIFKGYAEPY